MVKVDSQGVIDTSMLQAALDIIQSRFETEASGNVTISTIGSNSCFDCFELRHFMLCRKFYIGTIAQTNVDFISSGALTHSVARLEQFCVEN